jgi:hypothetical protein
MVSVFKAKTLRGVNSQVNKAKDIKFLWERHQSVSLYGLIFVVVFVGVVGIYC